MTATSNDHAAATSDQDAPTTADAAPVSVEQAAAILGVSVTTVRRRIRAGVLRAEEARRPQGPVWLVYLPAGAISATTSDQPATSSVATAPTTAEAMATYTRSILEPLVAALERSQVRVSELERELGRFAAERAVAEARYAALEARTAPQPVEPTLEPPAPRSAATTWLTPQRFWIIAALVLVLVSMGVVHVAMVLFSMAMQLAMPG